MKGILKKFQGWFFEMGDPHVPAALRMGYGLVYLFMLWDFYPDLALLMDRTGLNGTLSGAIAPLLTHPFGFLYHHDQPWEVRLWYWLSVLSVLCMTAGLFTRISTILTFLSIVLFQVRGPYFVYGADQVLLMCGLWLLFLDCGAAWSLDAQWRKVSSSSVNLWPVKTIQLQMALIYLLTGLSKVMTDSWRNGSAVYYALQLDGAPWARHIPPHEYAPIFIALTYLVLIIELSFAFLVFPRKTRLYALLAAFFVHLGIDVSMQIRFFSLTMYAGLLSFIDFRLFNPLKIRISKARYLRRN